eukprot:scaffold72495_cov63-Attheya_sp.AAC.2
MERLEARSILIGLIFVLQSSGGDYDVKFGWDCFSDFGWNNIPGTSHSKASYVKVLVVFLTT